MKTKFSAIILAFVAVATFFASCSKDESVQLPVVAFANGILKLDLNNQATLKVVSTVPATGTQNVDFTVAGGLVEGVDYTLSADQFTFEQGATEATVVVTFLKDLSDEAAFEVNLSPINFGTLGLAKASLSSDLNDAVLYTFDKSNYIMTASVDVTFQLSKITGSYVAEQDLSFEVEVDPTSTAVEGVHFEFAGSKVITVASGQNSGIIKLNLIKQENNKDQVVLKLKQVPFILKAGNYDKANIGIFGNIYDKMIGQWAYKTMSNLEWWKMNGSWTGDDLALLPTSNTAADRLTFDQNGITVSMIGVLKNYFKTSALVTLGEATEVLQEVASFPPARVQMLLVKSLVNVNFSATTTTEREAEVGFRVFTDTDGEEILEVTIRDYEPTDFLQNTYAMYKTFGDTPALKTMPLRYHFTKVK